MYCPNCEAEYQSGITTCKDCGIPLVEKLTPSTTIHDHSNATMVPLASFKFPGEAQMLEELLQKNNIRSFVQGATDTIAIPSGFSEVSVFVDERDLEKANELYQEFFEAEIDMPDGDDDDEEEESS
ncbi:MAG TPA: DUF2007 domain-containing protein [Blastocatellia bacterium]|nr:DUF2007 domain-containing protein [Blastocatellia bacterium]